MAPLVLSQVPEDVRTDSPLFGEFLETYFKYAAQRDKAIGTVQNHGTEMDVDLNSEENLDRFYAQYGQYFPKNCEFDKRNFIKLLNKIYEAKGTEKALKLVFKLLFNDQILVKYPSEQILRASGGIWTQDNFITVVTSFGDVPELPFMLVVSNNIGEYEIPVTQKVQVDPVTTRLYYRSFENVSYVDGQTITITDLNGDTKFTGKLIKTPSKLIIKNGGAGWLAGQVVVFDGTTKPTIARVTKVSDSGAILALDIIEHGYTHEDLETLIISPYPNRPAGVFTEITSVLNGVGTYHHTITIVDQTDGCTENVSGIVTGLNPEAYFLSEYVLDPVDGPYTGQVVIAVVSTQKAPESSNLDSLTIEEWLASRATLVFESSNTVKTKGQFFEDAGKLSNQEVRLQDNYYYQPFSYVIQTGKDIRDYETVMGLTHPAGMKRFSEIRKSLDYAFNFTSTRTISVDLLNVLDVTMIFDMSYLMAEKSLLSEITPIDTVTYNFSKVLASMATADDAVDHLEVEKVLNDSADLEETYVVSFEKALSDTTSNTETFDVTFIKPLADSVTPADQPVYALNKPIEDSVTADQDGSESVEYTAYDEDFFDEDYIETQIILTLG